MKNNKNDRISRINEIARQIGISSDEMFLNLKKQLSNEEDEKKLIWSLCRNLGCNEKELKQLVNEEIERRENNLTKKEIKSNIEEEFEPEELKIFEEFIKNYTDNYTSFKMDRSFKAAAGKRESLSKFGDKEQIKKYYMKYCNMIMELNDYIGNSERSETDIIREIYRGNIQNSINLSDWESVIKQRKVREESEKGIGE